MSKTCATRELLETSALDPFSCLRHLGHNRAGSALLLLCGTLSLAIVEHPHGRFAVYRGVLPFQ
jgi:hypothetical protein